VHRGDRLLVPIKLSRVDEEYAGAVGDHVGVDPGESLADT
jgi:hypothetical protein